MGTSRAIPSVQRRFCYGYDQKNDNFRPGDWECECGFTNFASRTECKSCGSAKLGGKNAGRPQYSKKSGDWDCECGFSNFASRTECKSCGTTRNPTSYND